MLHRLLPFQGSGSFSLSCAGASVVIQVRRPGTAVLPDSSRRVRRDVDKDKEKEKERDAGGDRDAERDRDRGGDDGRDGAGGNNKKRGRSNNNGAAVGRVQHELPYPVAPVAPYVHLAPVMQPAYPERVEVGGVAFILLL